MPFFLPLQNKIKQYIYGLPDDVSISFCDDDSSGDYNKFNQFVVKLYD